MMLIILCSIVTRCEVCLGGIYARKERKEKIISLLYQRHFDIIRFFLALCIARRILQRCSHLALSMALFGFESWFSKNCTLVSACRAFVVYIGSKLFPILADNLYPSPYFCHVNCSLKMAVLLISPRSTISVHFLFHCSLGTWVWIMSVLSIL